MADRINASILGVFGGLGEEEDGGWYSLGRGGGEVDGGGMGGQVTPSGATFSLAEKQVFTDSSDPFLTCLDHCSTASLRYQGWIGVGLWQRESGRVRP